MSVAPKTDWCILLKSLGADPALLRGIDKAPSVGARLTAYTSVVFLGYERPAKSRARSGFFYRTVGRSHTYINGFETAEQALREALEWMRHDLMSIRSIVDEQLKKVPPPKVRQVADAPMQLRRTMPDHGAAREGLDNAREAFNNRGMGGESQYVRLSILGLLNAVEALLPEKL